MKKVFLTLILLIFAWSVSYSNEDIKEGYINVKGGKVWYKIVGASKKGIPLLTLHGGPAFPHDYLEPLEALADERPVIFYDQLGCGNSDRPDDLSLWTIERFVDELEQIRKELKLEKVHILGQGWGNMLAVDYMLIKKPKGVVSLIFSSPCLSSSRFIEDQKAYLAELPPDLQKIISESEAAGKFTSPEYQAAMKEYYKLHVCRLEPWPDCFQRSMDKIGMTVYEYMWGPSEFTVTGILKDYERADRLKEIKTPTLFTCGYYDEVPPKSAKYYQSMMPGSIIAVFENSSHEHHIEQTQPYLKLVRNFLHSKEK